MSVARPHTTARDDRSSRCHASLVDAFRTSQVALVHGQVEDLFLLPTGNWAALDALITHVADEQGRATVRLSPTRAEQLLAPGAEPVTMLLPTTSVDPMAALEELTAALEARPSPETVVIVRSCDFLLDSIDPQTGARATDLLRRWCRFPGLRHHRLAVLTEAPLDRRLTRRPGLTSISVGLPDRRERHLVLSRAQEREHVPGRRGLASDVDLNEGAKLTAGMSSGELVQLFTTSGDPVSATDLLRAKRRRMNDQGGVRLLPETNGMKDIAGLPQVRLALQEWLKQGQVPRVVLLAGPPGCGKTLVVSALAHALSRAALELGEFRSPWVGQAELNLRERLDLTEQHAPALVLIDEADLLLGRRNTGPSSDGGTQERVQAMLLTHLGDRQNPAQVSWFLTTNVPGAIDEAGRDRADEIIPILHPEPLEQRQVLELAITRSHRVVSQDALDALNGRLGSFASGRQIVGIAHRAIALADLSRGPGSHVMPEDVIASVDDVMPRHSQEAVELMSLQAISLTTYASRLPWNAARVLGTDSNPPEWIRPMLDASGRPKPQLIAERIQQLTVQARDL